MTRRARVIAELRLVCLGVALSLLGASLCLAQPEADDRERATRLFGEGREALIAGEPEGALRAFRTSYELLPSPNTRLMVARTLVRLGRLLEAREAYARAEREARERVADEPRYLDTSVAARGEGAELEARLVALRIRLRGAGPDARVTVGDRVIDWTGLDHPVFAMPGRVEVAVREPDGRGDVWQEDVAAGSVRDVPLTVPSAVEPEAPDPSASSAPSQPDETPTAAPSRSPFALAGWSLLAGGLAAMAAFGVIYALDDHYYHQLTDYCSRVRCTSADVSDGRTFQALSNVLFYSSIALLAASVAFLVVAYIDVGSLEVAVGPTHVGIRASF